MAEAWGIREDYTFTSLAEIQAAQAALQQEVAGGIPYKNYSKPSMTVRTGSTYGSGGTLTGSFSWNSGYRHYESGGPLFDNYYYIMGWTTDGCMQVTSDNVGTFLQKAVNEDTIVTIDHNHTLYAAYTQIVPPAPVSDGGPTHYYCRSLDGANCGWTYSCDGKRYCS
jgi:hypothetical protein